MENAGEVGKRTLGVVQRVGGWNILPVMVTLGWDLFLLNLNFIYDFDIYAGLGLRESESKTICLKVTGDD